MAPLSLFILNRRTIQGLSPTVLKKGMHFVRFSKIVLGSKAIYFLKLGLYYDQMVLIRCNLQQLDLLNRLAIPFKQLKFAVEITLLAQFLNQVLLCDFWKQTPNLFFYTFRFVVFLPLTLSGISEASLRSPQTASVLGFKEKKIFQYFFLPMYKIYHWRIKRQFLRDYLQINLEQLLYEGFGYYCSPGNKETTPTWGGLKAIYQREVFLRHSYKGSLGRLLFPSAYSRSLHVASQLSDLLKYF